MYNWIETTFNVSGGVTQAIAVILALAVVLLLFSLFIFVLKRLMAGNASQNRNRQPRIAVMDSTSVDSRRSLVLIRRDNIEHLLLIGGPSDVVVEQNIVRNAPLTGNRPGTYPAPGHPGNGQVKSPMAPGPDIPATPEDMVQQPEPMPAATPVPAKPSAVSSVSPTPAASPARAQAAVPQPDPFKTRPVSMSSAPSLKDKGPAAPALPEKKREPAVFAKDTGASRNPAADLLRAATQNGFSRARSGPQEPRVDRTAPTPSATAAKAPEVKPDVTVGRETDAQPSGKTASALNPFSPRERPSYGGHAISPPASGPAARAKTALLRPAEAPQGPNRIEPVVAVTSGTSTAPVTKDADTNVLERDAKMEPALGTEEPAETTAPVEPAGSSVTAPGAYQPADALFGETEDKQPPATPETAVSAGPETAGAPSESDDIASSDQGEKADAGETEEAVSMRQEISLELEDLVEPQSPEPEASSEPADLVEEKQDQQQSQVRASEPVANEPAELSDSKAAAQPVKPAPRPTEGLGGKNPIEDEMAKILDELGGQPN